MPGRRTITLRFLTSPVTILGSDRVEAVEVVRNELKIDRGGVPRALPTGETEVLEAGMVLRSVGYRGEPVADLPYDPVPGTVPNEGGCVRPGLYVAGWVKRGPTGFIGTNKSCSEETVERFLDDLDAGLLATPKAEAEHLGQLLGGRGVQVVDLAGWQAIDHEERRRGASHERVRNKIVDIDEFLRVARPGRTRPRYAATRRKRENRG